MEYGAQRLLAVIDLHLQILRLCFSSRFSLLVLSILRYISPHIIYQYVVHTFLNELTLFVFEECPLLPWRVFD